MHLKYKIFNFWLMLSFIQLIAKLSFCEAIVCYKCDSITLEACATTLNEYDLPYETCKSLQCTMSIVDSVTYRGCSDTTPYTGATYKKSCNDNLCNKGVYPPGRLKCYQCNGQDCERVVGKPHPCPNHHEEDECYIDVIEINQVFRGCKSNANHTISSKAIYCDYNGCNNDPATSNLKCAQCDSKTGRGCKRDLGNKNITIYETCEMDVKINENSTCFLYHRLDRVIRGCSDLMPDEVKQDMNRTFMCSGPNFCNSGNLATQQCLKCSSEKGNNNCRHKPSEVATTFCSSPEASSCYAIDYKNWHVERGCSVLPNNASDINRSYECDTPKDCNTLPFIRCYQCSTENDTNCAAWQNPGFLEIEECETPGARCLVGTSEDGITRRGCESLELNCNHTSSAHCRVCEGSFCNRDPFPAERLLCYQCGTKENDCDAVMKRDPLPCPLSDFEPSDVGFQACFEYFNVQMGHVVRGCASNGLEYYRCMLQTQPSCELCTTNGCNMVLNNEKRFENFVRRIK